MLAGCPKYTTEEYNHILRNIIKHHPEYGIPVEEVQEPFTIESLDVRKHFNPKNYRDVNTAMILNDDNYELYYKSSNLKDSVSIYIETKVDDKVLCSGITSLDNIGTLVKYGLNIKQLRFYEYTLSDEYTEVSNSMNLTFPLPIAQKWEIITENMKAQSIGQGDMQFCVQRMLLLFVDNYDTNIESEYIEHLKKCTADSYTYDYNQEHKELSMTVQQNDFEFVGVIDGFCACFKQTMWIWTTCFKEIYDVDDEHERGELRFDESTKMQYLRWLNIEPFVDGYGYLDNAADLFDKLTRDITKDDCYDRCYLDVSDEMLIKVQSEYIKSKLPKDVLANLPVPDYISVEDITVNPNHLFDNINYFIDGGILYSEFGYPIGKPSWIGQEINGRKFWNFDVGEGQSGTLFKLNHNGRIESALLVWQLCEMYHIRTGNVTLIGVNKADGKWDRNFVGTLYVGIGFDEISEYSPIMLADIIPNMFRFHNDIDSCTYTGIDHDSQMYLFDMEVSVSWDLYARWESYNRIGRPVTRW